MSSNLVLLFVLASFGVRAQVLEAVEPHMGTLVRIKLYAENEQRASRAFRKAFDRIAELDSILSDYKPDSELNRVCRAAVGRPVKISVDLFRVLDAAQVLAGQTGGAFDVTLGPVIRLWRENRVPGSVELREAMVHTGYRKLHLDAANSTAMFDEPGMLLDLGGIGKGYAADEALAVLAQLGIRSALVAVSGDLAIGDAPPASRGWKVAIADGVRELHNCAVSTSGAAEQHVDAGGVRYSHIVDPATGLGLTHSITVTVIASRGIHADGLSTAISVLGAIRGKELIARYPGAEMVIR